MAYHLCLHSHCGNRWGPLSVIQPGRLGWDTSLAPGSWCYGTHDTPPPSLTFLLKQESANHFGVAIYVNHNKGVWCMVGTQKIVTARIITMATTAVGGRGCCYWVRCAPCHIRTHSETVCVQGWEDPSLTEVAGQTPWDPLGPDPSAHWKEEKSSLCQFPWCYLWPLSPFLWAQSSVFKPLP